MLFSDYIWLIPLHLTGGEDLSEESEDFTTDKVECYDPTANQWTTCASMRHSCSYPGVVAMVGKIYVLGGMDDDSM